MIEDMKIDICFNSFIERTLVKSFFHSSTPSQLAILHDFIEICLIAMSDWMKTFNEINSFHYFNWSQRWNCSVSSKGIHLLSRWFKNSISFSLDWVLSFSNDYSHGLFSDPLVKVSAGEEYIQMTKFHSKKPQHFTFLIWVFDQYLCLLA